MIRHNNIEIPYEFYNWKIIKNLYLQVNEWDSPDMILTILEYCLIGE